MKIDNHMISKKSVVGKRKDGSPVVFIQTHGGLFAFFSKNSKGEIETLGMAPHKAIASWMAEQKARDIKWDEKFNKSEDALAKSGPKHSNFVRLRNILFSKDLKKNFRKKSDYYIIYDTKDIVIGIMHKNDIQKGLDSGEIYQESFVRNINLTEPVEFISRHKDFRVG